VLRSSKHDRRKKGALQLLIVLLGCSAFSATFTYHAINGRHGLEARSKLLLRSAELRSEIKSLEAVQAEFSTHIKLLGDRPDKDLVEEIAQRDLGFAYGDDLIIRR